MAVIVTAAPPRFDCVGDGPWLAGGLEFGGQPTLETRIEKRGRFGSENPGA
jgi:hypothetical protein